MLSLGKKQLLCDRAAEHNSGVSGEMKTFIEGLFKASFTSFTELVQKDIQERFDKFDNEITLLKDKVSQITDPSDTVGKDREHLGFRVHQQHLGKNKKNHHRVRIF